MKLLILCVDGFDPEYARDNGFDLFKHSAALDIPRECYIDLPGGPQAHTVRVWPSMFSGRVIDYDQIRRSGIRRLAHEYLVKIGKTWAGPSRYLVSPYNEDLETVFTGRMAFTWNIPTISPEWISTFPGADDENPTRRLMAYCRREYDQFNMISLGLVTARAWDVAAIYTRMLDAQGHTNPDKVDWFYSHISSEAKRQAAKQQARGDHLMLVSDHGCLEGRHTDHAYIGATFPFEAESITDIRGVIEEALK